MLCKVTTTCKNAHDLILMILHILPFDDELKLSDSLSRNKIKSAVSSASAGRSCMSAKEIYKTIGTTKNMYVYV